MQHAVRSRHAVPDAIARQIADRGFAVHPRFISHALCERLVSEAQALREHGGFHAARVGAGDQRTLAPSVRSDRIHWLDEGALTPTQHLVFDALQALRVSINRHTFLGLFSWEGHLAVYPEGSFYKRHLDVFADQRERQLSTVLYLNTSWRYGDGGELRFYLDDGLERYVDIPPKGGTLITFLSERYYHEVLPAHTERWSLTGWFRVRPWDGR